MNFDHALKTDLNICYKKSKIAIFSKFMLIFYRHYMFTNIVIVLKQKMYPVLTLLSLRIRPSIWKSLWDSLWDIKPLTYYIPFSSLNRNKITYHNIAYRTATKKINGWKGTDCILPSDAKNIDYT